MIRLPLRRRYRPNDSLGVRVTNYAYGPDALGTADALALAGMTAGQLDGSRLGGLAHFGMRGGPESTFSGLVASPQQFVGQAQMGKTSAIVVQAYPALPNAAPPPANRQWLQDWTETEELLT